MSSSQWWLDCLSLLFKVQTIVSVKFNVLYLSNMITDLIRFSCINLILRRMTTFFVQYFLIYLQKYWSTCHFYIYAEINMDIINVLHIYKSIKFDNKTYREYCEYNVICKTIHLIYLLQWNLPHIMQEI